MLAVQNTSVAVYLYWSVNNFASELNPAFLCQVATNFAVGLTVVWTSVKVGSMMKIPSSPLMRGMSGRQNKHLSYSLMVLLSEKFVWCRCCGVFKKFN